MTIVDDGKNWEIKFMFIIKQSSVTQNLSGNSFSKISFDILKFAYQGYFGQRARWKELLRKMMQMRWPKGGFIYFFPDSLCYCFSLIKMHRYLVSKWDYFNQKSIISKVCLWLVAAAVKRVQGDLGGCKGDVSKSLSLIPVDSIFAFH